MMHASQTASKMPGNSIMSLWTLYFQNGTKIAVNTRPCNLWHAVQLLADMSDTLLQLHFYLHPADLSKCIIE